MSRPEATATLQAETDRVRVHRFDFAPGAETGWHTHEMDYVITTITACTMLLEDPDGSTRTVELSAGTTYLREKGVSHNVINAGSDPMAFVEVELK